MEAVRGILINFLVPLVGLSVFLSVRDRMREKEIERPPVVPFFIIFATYGGVLMVVLTDLFWYWSGMASLGAAYLMFLAPFLMTALAIILYNQRRISRYHHIAFIASVVYPSLVLPTVFCYFLVGHFSS